MSKKYILMVTNSLAQGGAERVLSKLLDHYYHDNAFEVELILLEDVIAYPLPEGLKVTILSSLHAEDSSLKKILALPFLAYKLHSYVRKYKPDLILSFIFRADYVNVLASLLHKRPIMVSQRVNASSTYDNSSLNAKINKFLLKALYPKADMVINVSEGTKADLAENFSVNEEKQIVIYNPYEIEKIRESAKETTLLKLDKERTIVAVSRFRAIKNVAMIIRAFARLNKETNLVLVGDGAQKERLKTLAKSLGIDKRVFFVGGQDNPYKFMSKVALYVSASRSEGFPNALIESMICGCAVISTDCPSGPREILAPQSNFRHLLKQGVEYTEYGTLVAVDDEEALYEALDEMLHNKDRREKQLASACKRINDFRQENIIKAYSQVFEQVIAGEKV